MQPIRLKWRKLKIKEITVFGMLGALMYASKMLMEIAPDVHLLVWTVLWGATMLLPRNMPKKLKPIITLLQKMERGNVEG